MLTDLQLKTVYRSTSDSFTDSLFVPLLKECAVYDRGTGFFSINALFELAQGIVPYIRRGGNIRIITSVELSETDFEIIRKGHELANTVIKEKLEKIIEEELADESMLLDLDLVTNLIADQRIVIKIAYLKNGGLYHEKIGYASDSDGNAVWIVGSINETYSGLKRNVESAVVIKSWESGFEEIDEQKKYFDDLWRNDISEIETVEFPDAARDKLFKLYKKSETTQAAIDKQIQNGLQNSQKKELFSYQREAIAEFLDNGCKHFYEMATGTGKTFTAIKTIECLNGKVDPLYVVILVPQIDLQEQWAESLRAENIEPYLFGGNGQTDWKTSFDKSVIEYYQGERLVVTVCIYDTYFSKLCNKMQSLKIKKMIVVDEAHSLSGAQLDRLSETFAYRLGLSATPDRFKKSETNKLLRYFLGDAEETFKYAIEDAIQNDFLSRYEYEPIPVELNEYEFAQYSSYSQKISVLMNQEDKDEDLISEISNARARVVKKATNKIEKLGDMVKSGLYEFSNSVIYCGQGKDTDAEESIIDLVTKILKTNGDLNVSQFTSKTANRPAVLAEFESGYYDTLVAIKCFDQGVDVPKLDKIYIMASDTSIRQTIQRRGRVLRKCKETGKKLAYIYDFVALPPAESIDAPAAKTLVSKELIRVHEYMRLAENYDECKLITDQWEEMYGVEDDEGGEQE